jgi:hypothetical protein
MQNADDPSKPTVLTPEEARQGETTGRVRWILGLSLALAVLAGIGFLIYY